MPPVRDEMVETVARALAKADGKDPDAPAWVEGYGNRERTFGVCWRDQYLLKAEAAIEALTASQVEAGEVERFKHYVGMSHSFKPHTSFDRLEDFEWGALLWCAQAALAHGKQS